MRKRMILTALAAVAIPTLLMAADEARLMRFPATNGSEIVFSYAGDLYKVPATGGEAQRNDIIRKGLSERICNGIRDIEPRHWPANSIM